MTKLKYIAYAATTLAVTLALSGCLHHGVSALPI